MQTVSDELCREYRLSVIENPQYGKAKQYGEWRAEQEQRPTWRWLIRADMDEAIRQSMTERQFFDNLRKKGYEVKIGKDISVRPPGKERFVRLIRNFGEDYSIEQIRRRILSQTRAEKKPSEPTRQVIRIRLFGSLKKTRKITGFRALYFHYCYLLGIFPKNKPKQNRRRLHFLLREDLRKLDDITAKTRLLVRNRIDTAEQLFSYRDEAQDKIAALTAERKQLYKLQRTAAVKADPEKSAEIKDRISALSKELATLRKEVSLCDDIAERSGVIKEKIKAVREDEHMKNTKKASNKLPVPGKVRKGVRFYCAAVLSVALVLGCSVPAFAANDPIAVVNNLSDFIFGLIRAVGLILLGWGIVQVGLSFQSHDPSQRSNGFLTLAGGIVITFAKEILNLITG